MISVIVASRSPERLVVMNQRYREALSGETVEFLGITNATSLAAAFNSAALAAHAETLIFSHDDLQILSDGMGPILHESLTTHDLVGVAGANRVVGAQWTQAGPPHLFGQVVHAHPGGNYVIDIFGAPRRSISRMKVLDGLFMAMRREFAVSHPFDAVTFDGFHCYDVDFSFSAHLQGARLCVRCDINLVHDSIGNYSSETWMKYAQRFIEKHQAHFDDNVAPKMQWTARVTRDLNEAKRIVKPVYWDSE